MVVLVVLVTPPWQVPLSAYQPSAVCLYWVTSATIALATNLALMHPRWPTLPSSLLK